MTRVAYLTSEYPARSHTFIKREVEALRLRGLEILPFSVRAIRSDADESAPSILGLGWARCVVIALKLAMVRPWRAISTWLLALRHRPPGLRGLLWSQFHFVEALAFAGMLEDAGADRVHSHFANSGATVAMLAASYLGLPWSLTLHGISETDGVAGTLMPEKLHRADFVACASWFMRAQAMRVTPPELWPKFHIVRCGVALSALPTAKAPENRDLRRLVTVGRLSAEKGYPGLLGAIGALLQEGVDLELTVVGDGPLRGAIVGQAAQLGLGGRLRMLGALPEAATLAAVAEADIFVLASLMEGLPVVLMEALALGKPVVAPAVAGIPELVVDGRNGLLFRPGDWEQLARKIASLIADPDAYRAMAKHGPPSVACDFEISAAVEPLAKLLLGGIKSGERQSSKLHDEAVARLAGDENRHSTP